MYRLPEAAYNMTDIVTPVAMDLHSYCHETAHRRGQSKKAGAVQPKQPWKSLAGVAALAPAYISLVVFRRKGRTASIAIASGQVGAFSFELDSGPMIVSRPQSPKGPSAFCTLRPVAQSQHLWGAMTRCAKTRPDHSIRLPE